MRNLRFAFLAGGLSVVLVCAAGALAQGVPPGMGGLPMGTPVAPSPPVAPQPPAAPVVPTMPAPAAAAQVAPDTAAEQPAAKAKPVKKKRKVVAKKKPKAPRKMAEPAAPKAGPGQILISNDRAAGLVSLTMVSAQGQSKEVAKNLASGAKTVAKIPPKAGCVFNISGEFDDGSTLEAQGVEVCKDRTLNLVD